MFQCLVYIFFINRKPEEETQPSSKPNIKLILLKHGLNPKKWCEEFNDLGITSREDISEIEGSSEAYNILSSNASETEKIALKKLLNIELENFSKQGSIASDPRTSMHVVSSVMFEDAKKLSKKEFLAYLHELGLLEKFPQKLTIQDALLIRHETLIKSNKTEQIEVLPILILQRIMNSDYRNRKCLLDNSNTSKDCYDDDDDDDDDDGSKSALIHPLDIFLAILHCCDELLRQDLFAKVYNCKLALPFILPNPVENSLTFLLWAMRAIISVWKVKCPVKIDKWLPRECSVVDYKMPIIGFMRLGNCEQSKSKILNAIIGESNHDYFFHWDCDGGSHKRQFVDGLVEFCCYLPSGKETDCYSDAALFINLRGDFKHHPKQVQFIKSISFMLFILTNTKDLNDNTISKLQEFSNLSGGIVLLLSSNADQAQLGSLASIKEYIKVQLAGLNLATIRDKVKKILVKKLQKAEKKSFKTISDCAMVAKDLKINIDENNTDCNEGKILANDIMEKIIINSDKMLPKETIVPLQGSDLWQQWADYDKECRRHLKREKKNVAFYNDEIDEHKCNIRQKQLAKSLQLSPGMNSFLNSIKTTSGRTKNYFLKWLKLFLDNYSRKILPGLHDDYFTLKEKLKSLVANNANQSLVEAVQKELEQKNKNLTEASFGLEHFFREIAQLYEARMDPQLCEVPEHFKNDVLDLPQIMIEIMQHGFALELMDGDASHIPLTWILAVIKMLKIQYEGKNICVLSVIGIQSTGKSTLLNTMFGLQFNVSAGRCTRGAFFQLLPLNDTLQNKINCSHILVVDTEGLRAPELQSTMGLTKHDNELATFVIGLADITIVNIYGEAPGDIDDILQTAIHAFIRMANVDLHPSCLFVHQNVTSTLAIFKGEAGRKKFQDKLDCMTQCAAKVENCAEKYQVFSQIIKFDDKHNVFPFPVLWEGSPPMAPICTEYSESAVNLTSALTHIIENQMCMCTIDQLETRIKGLWEAVLLEKFVFSFKNTMEVAAYSDLDTEFAQWSWKIQQKTYELQIEADTLISNCKDNRSIEKQLPPWLENAKIQLNMVYGQQRNKMEEYLKRDKNKLVILSQWQSNTAKRLSEVKNDSETKLKDHCTSSKAYRQTRFEVDEIKSNYQKEFQTYLKTEIEKSKETGVKLSASNIDSHFKVIWDNWIEKVESKNADLATAYATDDYIESSFMSSLHTILKSDDSKALIKLIHLPIAQRGYELKLEIDKHSHLNVKGWRKHVPFNLVESVPEKNIADAKNQTIIFLAESKKVLQNDTGNFKNFDSAIMYDLLLKLNTNVKNFNETNKLGFKFTTDYDVDILLVVGAYAIRYYKEKMATIRQKNNPLQTLKSSKVLYLNYFKSEYNEISQETAAAENFCHLVVESIRIKQTQSITLEIVKKMKRTNPKFFVQEGFKIMVLEDLAREENFESYKLFLSDIRSCFQVWAKNYVEHYCNKKIQGKSKFMHLVEEKLCETMDKVAEEAKTLTNCKNIEMWLVKFHQKFLQDLVLDLPLLQRTVGVRKLNKLDYFTSQVIEGLNKAKNNFILELEASGTAYFDVMNCGEPPHLILYKSIIGCSEQCPFCGEQCDLNNDHIHSTPHFTKVHRPSCLRQYIWLQSKKLTFDLCNESVGSDATFQNPDTNYQPIPFKQYKTIYKNWYIPPGKPEIQPFYWQWFVAKFNSEIEQWCNAVPTPVPTGWTKITKQGAVASLVKTYKIDT